MKFIKWLIVLLALILFAKMVHLNFFDSKVYMMDDDKIQNPSSS